MTSLIEGLEAALEILSVSGTVADATVSIEALLQEHKELHQLQLENDRKGFCGDPYLHDCGRPNCQTSDSFVQK